MRWKMLLRSYKALTFLFMVKRGQKENVESNLDITSSLSLILQMGWATRTPSTAIIPLRGLICEFSFREGWHCFDAPHQSRALLCLWEKKVLS